VKAVEVIAIVSREAEAKVLVASSLEPESLIEFPARPTLRSLELLSKSRKPSFFNSFRTFRMSLLEDLGYLFSFRSHSDNKPVRFIRYLVIVVMKNEGALLHFYDIGKDHRMRKRKKRCKKVIINGDSLVPEPPTIGTVVPPKTKTQKLARKNELKAKTIKIRFRGNKESKKMHKAILKQQYKNFVASRSEGLDKTYDRFHKLISQLELNGEVISQEDANMKLLRSLPPAWNNIALIIRNKHDIETLNMDDLYNNLKVYEAEINVQSSSGSNSHNVDFVSSKNTSSINKIVNAAHDIPTASSKEKPSASSYIDTDDLEEMDLKWQVAMITMRVKKFMKRTWRNLNFNGKDPVSFYNTKVECYNCHRIRHFARECRAPRNQGNRSADNERRVVPVETPVSALVVQDGLDNNQANDRYKVRIGYHAVSPPYTGNYMPPRADLSFAGLDDSVFNFKISETITSVDENESIASKSSEEIREEPKTVRSSDPIIKDWESDSQDECENKTSTEQEISSNNNLVKSVKCTNKYISKKHTNNHDENLRKRQDSKVDWNDCTFYENKMVEKSMVNNKGKGTCQREVRPVWNNARRLQLSQDKVNAAKQNSAASTSTARPKINIAAIRPNVNVKSSYFKPHSPKRRHFNKKSKAKSNTFSRKINTDKGKNVTTAGPKAVVNAAEGKKENVVKSSARWIWRPKGKLVDHTPKDSGSYTLKRFNYVDPNGRLKSVMAWVPKSN
nr:hypothetical protein [Tanacetum cinerariifolium]